MPLLRTAFPTLSQIFDCYILISSFDIINFFLFSVSLTTYCRCRQFYYIGLLTFLLALVVDLLPLYLPLSMRFFLCNIYFSSCNLLFSTLEKSLNTFVKILGLEPSESSWVLRQMGWVSKSGLGHRLVGPG